MIMRTVKRKNYKELHKFLKESSRENFEENLKIKESETIKIILPGEKEKKVMCSRTTLNQKCIT